VILVRWLGEALIRLYYPRRDVVAWQQGSGPGTRAGVGAGEGVAVGRGAQAIDSVPRGPVIFVANHPNGLLDPLLVRVASRRPARFLAKSTLFGNPFGRLAMDAFGCFPIARVQDAGRSEGAASKTEQVEQERRAKMNEETFARCYEALGRGDAIALFPEGTSHSDPHMRPFKTGAARIALGAEAAGAAKGQRLGLHVVPVGLSYDRKTTFRSGALVVFGEPLEIASLMPEYGANPRATVEDLTEAIRKALDAVVLQADTKELLASVSALAQWTTPASSPEERAQRLQRAQALMQALAAEGPAQSKASRRSTSVGLSPPELTRLLSQVRLYAGALRRLGVRNPWALDLELVTLPAALVATARLLVALPLAGVGALLGWVPYRLAGIVASKITREEDVLSTVKLIAGVVFLLVAWTGEALALAAWLDRDAAHLATGVTLVVPAALLIAALGMGGGYLALCVEEWARESWLALRYTLVRWRHGGTVSRLVAQRQELVDQVTAALERVVERNREERPPQERTREERTREERTEQERTKEEPTRDGQAPAQPPEGA